MLTLFTCDNRQPTAVTIVTPINFTLSERGCLEVSGGVPPFLLAAGINTSLGFACIHRWVLQTRLAGGPVATEVCPLCWPACA